MAFPEPGVLGAADVTRGEFRTAIEDFLAATVAGVAAHGRQAFTASGTFTVPAGVTQIWARVICGGGGAGGSWATGNANNAADGVNGDPSLIVRSGSTLILAVEGIRGRRGTSSGAGAPGLASHARTADSSGGNCSMLPPYGKGGDAVYIGGGGNSGGGGGASEGVFGLLSVSAGQTLTITVGAGGAGGAGSTPGGFGGPAGNSGIVLLEW